MRPLRLLLVVVCLKLANTLLALACKFALAGEGGQFAIAASELGSNGAASKLHADAA